MRIIAPTVENTLLSTVHSSCHCVGGPTADGNYLLALEHRDGKGAQLVLLVPKTKLTTPVPSPRVGVIVTDSHNMVVTGCD
mmetsp:Transcript_25105/g.35395  ORF Transcript_25105/g.35395 Transcript_25105/m.35395 type:complete len:81 (+) Transcript_25105:553-795(+)